ncbi:PilZ domain-containing protein [Sphingomonas sp.]|uniref:PilZ domain-containing protein n=1 Tax=Sphingomonas sp. TaxID=28214 RepID=UPI0038A89F97
MHLSHEERRLAGIAGRAREAAAATNPPVNYSHGPLAPSRYLDWRETEVDPGGELALDRRAHRRLGLVSRVVIRPIGGFNCEVRLDDASAAGCRVEMVEPVDVGESLIARLPELEPLVAKVCWTKHTTAGLSFSKPMHPAVFDTLLTRLP